MKKLFPALLLLLAVGLGVDAKAAEWRLGVITPPAQLWTTVSQRFADDVAAASGNRHTIKVFPAAQLGNEAEMLRQLQRGSLDFLLITASELANHVDAFNALLAPGLVESNEHAARFFARGEEPRKMLALLEQRLGVRGLAYGMGGVMQVITNFDATGPEDLTGRKIRIIPSPAVRDFNNILGTVPLPIPLPGVYDAFANGQVNAVELNFDVIRVLRLHEHGKIMLVTNQTMNPGVVLVSVRLWRSLADEDKAVVQKAAQDYGQRLLDGTVAAEAKSREELKRQGLAIKDVPRSAYDQFIAKWDALWVPKVPQITAFRREAAAMAGD